MSRYYKAKIKKLTREIAKLHEIAKSSDRDMWKLRAEAAEEKVNKYDMSSTYNQGESNRIGMDAMAKLAMLGLSYCAQCNRETIKLKDNVCIACGVKSFICE